MWKYWEPIPSARSKNGASWRAFWMTPKGIPSAMGSLMSGGDFSPPSPPPSSPDGTTHRSVRGSFRQSPPRTVPQIADPVARRRNPGVSGTSGIRRAATKIRRGGTSFSGMSHRSGRSSWGHQKLAPTIEIQLDPLQSVLLEGIPRGIGRTHPEKATRSLHWTMDQRALWRMSPPRLSA